MSSAKGKSRTKKDQKSKDPVVILNDDDANSNAIVAPVPEPTPRPKKMAHKNAEDLRRIMDIIQSRISVIIDTLEIDDNDISLKRNVVTAVKHLKQINELLS